MSVAIETRKVVILSTLHLTAQTINLLSATPMPEWPVAGGHLPFGFYVYAHDCDGGETIPTDLWACCTWARLLGFDYIQFEGDADPHPDLTAHEHGDDIDLNADRGRFYGAALLAQLRVLVNEASIAGAYAAPHVTRARTLIEKIDGKTKN